MSTPQEQLRQAVEAALDTIVGCIGSDDARYCESVKTVTCDKLMQAIAPFVAAKRDSERIDWLEKNRRTVMAFQVAKGLPLLWACWNAGGREFKAETARAAPAAAQAGRVS